MHLCENITYAKSKLCTYLKNWRPLINFKNVNFFKKGSPKKHSTTLFFMWSRNHLNVLMRNKYVQNWKFVTIIFYEFCSFAKINFRPKKKCEVFFHKVFSCIFYLIISVKNIFGQNKKTRKKIRMLLFSFFHVLFFQINT